VFSIVWLVGLLLAGMIVVWLVPWLPTAAALELREHGLRALALGMLALAAVPLTSLPLALTMVGLPTALIALGLWGLGLLVGWLALGGGVGQVLYERASPRGVPRPVVTMAIGLVALWFVGQLPILGTVVAVIGTGLGLGLLIALPWHLRAGVARVEPLASPAIATE
jgi:hypothetical protein